MGKSPDTAGDWQLYLRLLRYVYQHKRAFILSVIGFALYAGAAVLLADLMQLVIDTAGGAKKVGVGLTSKVIIALCGGEEAFKPNASLLVPLAMFVVIVIRGIGFFVGNYYITHVARMLVHKLRCNVFDHLLYTPSAYFDAHNSGHLLSRITYNVDQVTGAATDAVKIVLREGFTVIGLLGFMLYVNWKLTLVFFAIAPIIAGIVSIVGKMFRRYSTRIQHSVGDVTHVSNEIISSYRDVRLYGGMKYEQGRFHDASEYNRSQSMKMAAASSASPPVIQVLVGIAMGVLVYLVLPPVSLGELSSGQLVAFLTAAGLLAKPIRSLSEVQGIIQKGLAAAEDIFAFIDSPAEPDKGEHVADQVAGRLAFNNVSFRYNDEDEEVLRNVSFTVEPGQTVALVGGSGSGKSTLVNLLARFYENTGGEITLDGVDVREYTLENLRAQMAFVSQQISLFNDTIYNNIAYGDLAAKTREQVVSAVQAANAQGFIEELPEGFETIVGDNGLRLSGGQRQRLAIARALLKDAPLLILDEATSALDNESEAYIQNQLEVSLSGRTTLVIAHRLSTIEAADLILVLEDGELVEQGSHAELMALDARYKRLHQRQFEG
jgi:subfamily B ATP-binding cassette protein MsbA